MNPSELAAKSRSTLREGRAALQARYQESPNAATLLRRHASLVDHVLTDIWRRLKLPRQAALLAVGGYGRKELYPYSDVDLLILLPEGQPVPGEPLEKLVGLLWDIGLEVGHSVRTLSQCLEEAEKDITVQTNLLESRHLCGDRDLFTRFRRAFSARLSPPLFFEAKQLEQQQRHQRYHGTTYNLEPNLKESPGGLRDLQTVLWVCQGAGLGRTWGDLVKNGFMTPEEGRRARTLERHLQNLRIRLHYLAGRREDRLLFDYQNLLASRSGYMDEGNRLGSERLMQQYYRCAKAVNLLNEILMLSVREHVFPIPLAAPISLTPRFQARNGLIEACAPDTFEHTPSALLEIFLLLEQNPGLQGIQPATLRALWRALRHIDGPFRREPAHRRLFLAILSQPQGVTHALRRMHRYGVLGRYLPGFGRIIGQMQHDLFHVYTVDEHTLFVVRNLRRFTVPEFAHEFPLCSRLINGFAHQEILMVAALFHDIAKGRGGDHSRLGRADARRFCRQHGLSEQDTAFVCWLVENHLVMSATAQKQDLSDPEVIEAFATRVKDERHLVALYLLTVADIRGTSPKVWNTWKGQLLEELFLATRKRLADSGGAAASAFLENRQQDALALLRQAAFRPEAHRPLWQELDEGYFLRHTPNEIAWHTRVLESHVNTPVPIVRARLVSGAEGLQVLIYTQAHSHLFARICSFFEKQDFNIVEARIHTTRHGYALDSFVALDEGGRIQNYRDILNYIEYELARYLESADSPGPRPSRRISRQLKHFPLPPQVNIVPDEKNAYHVLSLTAGDRPGLLSQVAQVFARHGLELHMAKIVTLGDRAEDTFLVTGAELEKPKQVIQLEADLLETLQPLAS